MRRRCVETCATLWACFALLLCTVHAQSLKPSLESSDTPRAVGSTWLQLIGTNFYSPGYPQQPTVVFSPAMANVTITDLDCVPQDPQTLACTLTVQFLPLPSSLLGQTLTAAVVYEGQSSGPTQVAVVVPQPRLSISHVLLETGSRQMYLTGNFFSTVATDNVLLFGAPGKGQVSGHVYYVNELGTVLNVQLDVSPRYVDGLGPLNASLVLFGYQTPFVTVATIVLADVDSSSTIICGGTDYSPLPVSLNSNVECVVYIMGNGDSRAGEIADFEYRIINHVGDGFTGTVDSFLLANDNTEVHFTYYAPLKGSSEQIVVHAVRDQTRYSIINSPITVALIGAGGEVSRSWWDLYGGTLLSILVCLLVVVILAAGGWHLKRWIKRHRKQEDAHLIQFDPRVRSLTAGGGQAGAITAASHSQPGAQALPPSAPAHLLAHQHSHSHAHTHSQHAHAAHTLALALAPHKDKGQPLASTSTLPNPIALTSAPPATASTSAALVSVSVSSSVSVSVSPSAATTQTVSSHAHTQTLAGSQPPGGQSVSVTVTGSPRAASRTTLSHGTQQQQQLLQQQLPQSVVVSVAAGSTSSLGHGT